MCNGPEPFELLWKRPTKDHSCEVWSKSSQWFRRCHLKKLFMDGRMDKMWSQKLTLSPLSLRDRWAKKNISFGVNPFLKGRQNNFDRHSILLGVPIPLKWLGILADFYLHKTKANIKYHIYPKYWDTLPTYHTCPKIWNSPFYLLMCPKILQYVWQTM